MTMTEYSFVQARKPVNRQKRATAQAAAPSFLWCRDPESNWGRQDFQSCALPTELSRHHHQSLTNVNFSNIAHGKQEKLYGFPLLCDIIRRCEHVVAKLALLSMAGQTEGKS